jgi:ribosome-associated protein
LVKNMSESKNDFTESAEVISKSQRRREALEIKSLATRLIGLTSSLLAKLPLDEPLRAAITEARSIHARVAHKRQMQYVAKLIRRIDPQSITQALEAFEGDARHLKARQHRTEAWRDHLIEAGDPAVGELLQSRSGADAQAIRQLIRNTRQEAARNKPPAAARALFRLLREMEEREPLPPLPTDRAGALRS